MKINKINSDFNFSKIELSQPKGVQGGNSYTTKITYNNEPLLFQTTKCKTRNGFVTNGRKSYIDLMFDSNDKKFVEWIENIEQTLQKKILENSSEWFENELSSDDIENSFLPCIKPFKSGRWYLLRCNTTVLSGNLSNNSLKIYSEDNNDLEMSDITAEKDLITILQVSDIKFTSKNFQLDFIIKQVMLLNEINLNNNKLIKLDDDTESEKTIIEEKKEKLVDIEELKIENLNNNETQDKTNESNNINKTTTENEQDKVEEVKTEEVKTEEVKTEEVKTEEAKAEEVNTKEVKTEEVKTEEAKTEETKTEEVKTEEVKTEEVKTEEVKTEEVRESNRVLERTESLENKEKSELSNKEVSLEDCLVDLDLQSSEHIKLKDPSEVYYEIYNNAKKRAQELKQNAVNAFLELNNIKKKYNLKNILDSDNENEEF